MGKHMMHAVDRPMQVHVLCASSKPHIMGLAMSGHRPGCSLTSLQPGVVQAPGGAQYEVVRWREPVHASMTSVLAASTSSVDSDIPSCSNQCISSLQTDDCSTSSGHRTSTTTATSSGRITYHVLCLEGASSGVRSPLRVLLVMPALCLSRCC